MRNLFYVEGKSSNWRSILLVNNDEISFRNNYKLEGVLTSCSITWPSRTINVISYNTLMFTFAYFIPLFVMVYCNISIYLKVNVLFSTFNSSNLKLPCVEIRCGVPLKIQWLGLRLPTYRNLLKKRKIWKSLWLKQFSLSFVSFFMKILFYLWAYIREEKFLFLYSSFLV